MRSWTPQLLGGRRILLARAEQARDVLPEGLVELGVTVDVVPVYRARAAGVRSRRGRRGAARGPGGHPHLHQFEHGPQLRRAGGARSAFRTWPPGRTVASIGPITTATFKEYGITPQIEPAAFTIPALAAAIIEYFGK